MTNNKRISLTVLFFASIIAFIILTVLCYITKSFVFAVIFEAFFNLNGAFLGTMIFGKVFKDQITVSMKKAKHFCGLTLIAYGVLDTVRYAVSGGIRSLLFIPVWLPICFMMTMYYSTKDNGSYKEEMRKATCFIGIPLLIISLFLEIISFIDV